MSCTVCSKPLAGGTRCQIERFAHPVGREGRHDGGCWGGRFPTEKQLHEWQEWLRERARAGYEAPRIDAFPEIQLELELP